MQPTLPSPNRKGSLGIALRRRLLTMQAAPEEVLDERLEPNRPARVRQWAISPCAISF